MGVPEFLTLVKEVGFWVASTICIVFVVYRMLVMFGHWIAPMIELLFKKLIEGLDGHIATMSSLREGFETQTLLISECKGDEKKTHLAIEEATRLIETIFKKDPGYDSIRSHCDAIRSHLHR